MRNSDSALLPRLVGRGWTFRTPNRWTKLLETFGVLDLPRDLLASLWNLGGDLLDDVPGVLDVRRLRFGRADGEAEEVGALRLGRNHVDSAVVVDLLQQTLVALIGSLSWEHVT